MKEAIHAFGPNLRRDNKASDELEHTRSDNAVLLDFDACRYEAGFCPASPAAIHSARPCYLVHCFPSDVTTLLVPVVEWSHAFD